jgi:CRP-like cAMP-binding protein
LSTEETKARNGSAPADPLAGIIDQLEHELAPITARKSQLEAEIGDLIKQEGRIKAGISALRTGAPKKPSSSAPSTGGTKPWKPSQKTVDDVYATIATAAEPLTIAQITEAVDTSRGTVEKAVNALRAEQKIRLAGVAASPGAPKTFGTMP